MQDEDCHQDRAELKSLEGLTGPVGSGGIFNSVGRAVIIRCSSIRQHHLLGGGCFLVLIAILIPNTITVDRSRQEIVLRKLSYGPKTRIIPFSAVEALQVGYRRNLGLVSNDWQVTLLLTDRAVAIAHSRNELRIRQLGSAISRLVGVKFVSDTFKLKNTFQGKGAWFYSGTRQPPPH